jgi:CTP synthase (UTP-ammonia lyase)
MGGSLRLGANDVMIKENTIAKKIYNSSTISKRHRHRYEINQKYIPQFEKNG